MSVLTEYAGQA